MAFKIDYENKDELIIYPKGELDVFTTPELKKEEIGRASCRERV